jgi:flap endonuclease-1
VDYLVREKGFSEERVRAGAARLSKGLKTKQQGILSREELTVGRLEGFFKVLPKTPEEVEKQKRKAETEAANRKAAKKSKAGGGAPGKRGK